MITNNYLFASQFVNYLKSKKIDQDQLQAFKSVYLSFSKKQFSDGNLDEINDFIKHIINILQFAYDDFELSANKNGCYCYLYNGFPLIKKISCIYFADPKIDIDSTTKGSFPALEIIQLLKKEKLEWGILTNGTRWRLYSTLNSQPYENYFEIDFSSSDDSDFHAFFQLFSVILFIPDDHLVTPLERFMETSEKEAKIIEDHLRTNINEILETISFGFLSFSGKISSPLSEEERQEYFNNSVYLLFRLLFIFYAESRRLLPIDSPDYNPISLEVMLSKSKLWLIDSVFENENDTNLWTQFRELCINIDNGNKSFNIPEYDGGLFDILQHPFLNDPNHQLTNQIFAKVLYGLGYFTKGKSLLKINYRDLSVRNLGTLYEGILEYRLFIAKEDLVLRDKKFIPKAVSGVIKKNEREILAGQVYFSQDADERHETGSYYTPEDVVDYMISTSLRLGLEERWIRFLPTVKKYESDLKSSYNLPIRDSLLRKFDEELLNFINSKVLAFKVIDPAMGSGHFLVNALHCITHFIIEVLSTNVDINSGPIKQQETNIVINWSLFAHVSNLSMDPVSWRRKVVENCIFGIDLNPLATELSKLSLWIASSSEGKPLTFINHHLKKGDSIMGVSLSDIQTFPISRYVVQSENEPKLFDKLDTTRIEILKSRFAEFVSLSSDDISNVFSKKEIYSEIESNIFLKHLKDLASLWLMISFDLNKTKIKSLFDIDILPDESKYFDLLERVQIIDNDQDWQETIGIPLFKEIQKFNSEKEVFHWEFEFPEILNIGFDAAIGNPPYVDVPIEKYIGVPLKTAQSSNLYAYIPERSFSMLKDDCFLSFITPLSIMCSKRMIHIQKIFSMHAWYLFNIDSTSNPGTLFDNVKTSISIFSLRKDFSKRILTTNYKRFYSNERKKLFKDNNYYQLQDEKLILGYTIPKISSAIEEKILKILFDQGDELKNYISESSEGNLLYYRSAGNPYYRLAFDSAPNLEVNGMIVYSTSLKKVMLSSDYSQYILLSTIFSSLYYWFWTVYSDCYHLNPKDFFRFPLDLSHFNNFKDEFKELYLKIKTDLEDKGEDVVYNKKNGVTKYKLFRARRSKPVFDEVDMFLGEKLGFSNDMINFLIKFDINFRTDKMPRRQLDIIKDLFIAHRDNNDEAFSYHAEEYVRYLQWKKFGYKAKEFEDIVNQIATNHKLKESKEKTSDRSTEMTLFSDEIKKNEYPKKEKQPYVWQISKGAQVDFMQASVLLEFCIGLNKSNFSISEFPDVIGYSYEKAEGFSRILSFLGLLEDKTKKPTKLAQLIMLNDKYFEDIGTLWYIHYLIASDNRLIIWNRIANYLFPKPTFDYDDVVILLDDQRQNHSVQSFTTHLRKEYNTCIKAYIESGFSKLNITSIEEAKSKCNKTQPHLVPDEVLLASIWLFKERYYRDEVAIEIKLLANSENSPGRLFYITERYLRDALDRLRVKGFIVVESFADLDQIKFVLFKSSLDVLSTYFTQKLL